MQFGVQVVTPTSRQSFQAILYAIDSPLYRTGNMAMLSGIREADDCIIAMDMAFIVAI